MIDQEEVGVDHAIDPGRLEADQERDQGVKAKGSNMVMVLKHIQTYTCMCVHICISVIGDHTHFLYIVHLYICTFSVHFLA